MCSEAFSAEPGRGSSDTLPSPRGVWMGGLAGSCPSSTETHICREPALRGGRTRWPREAGWGHAQAGGGCVFTLPAKFLKNDLPEVCFEFLLKKNAALSIAHTPNTVAVSRACFLTHPHTCPPHPAPLLVNPFQQGFTSSSYFHVLCKLSREPARCQAVS